jgi:hypothetical protein
LLTACCAIDDFDVRALQVVCSPRNLLTRDHTEKFLNQQ